MFFLVYAINWNQCLFLIRCLGTHKFDNKSLRKSKSIKSIKLTINRNRNGGCVSHWVESHSTNPVHTNCCCPSCGSCLSCWIHGVASTRNGYPIYQENNMFLGRVCRGGGERLSSIHWVGSPFHNILNPQSGYTPSDRVKDKLLW